MTGLAAGDAYIHDELLLPVSGNFSLAPVVDTPISCYVSDVDIGATSYQVQLAVDNTGYIVLREMRDSTVNIVMNVAQLEEANITIAVVFAVA